MISQSATSSSYQGPHHGKLIGAYPIIDEEYVPLDEDSTSSSTLNDSMKEREKSLAKEFGEGHRVHIRCAVLYGANVRRGKTPGG
jgi:hypothetical protein